MFGRSRRERIKEDAASASELALQLAQDRRFRKRLLSALEHTSKAGRRTRRSLGATGVIARLASDRTLLQELKRVRRDLEQAYERLENKRRSHKFRNVIVLGSLASLAAVPQLRQQIIALIRKGTKRGRGPSGYAAGSRTMADSSAGAARLEDMTKDELYARAQEADIPGRSEMSKDELIEALQARG